MLVVEPLYSIKDDKMSRPQTLLSRPCTLLIKNEPGEAIFEVAVGQAIDEILSALGENSKQAIYSHLKMVYGIDKEDIPYKVEDFAKAIEQTFGSVAKVIEIKIIERLHSQYEDFCYAPKNRELDFAEYITDMQNCLEPKV